MEHRATRCPQDGSSMALAHLHTEHGALERVRERVVNIPGVRGELRGRWEDRDAGAQRPRAYVIIRASSEEEILRGVDGHALASDVSVTGETVVRYRSLVIPNVYYTSSCDPGSAKRVVRSAKIADRVSEA